MFKIDKDPKFWADVLVHMPGEPVQDFRARFRVLPIETFNSFDLDNPEDVAKLLRQIVVETSDIDNKDVADLEIMDLLLANPITRGALINAYLVSIHKAARGN